jgi:hypothetical protein
VSAAAPTSGARLRALLAAGVAARRDAWPIGPMIVHGSLAAGLALLVNDALGPFAYALWALSIHAALVGVPLLGDLGVLVRSDPAAPWIRAQPVRGRELALARLVVGGALVGLLAFAGLAPFALFAPHAMGPGARAALVVLGLAQVLFVGGALLALESASERIGRGLVLGVQSALVLGSALGLLLAPRLVPALRALDGPSDALRAWPPAWFAAPFAAGELTPGWRLAAPAALLAGLAALGALPGAPAAERTRRRGDLVGRLVAPLRALATRLWVRPGPERAVFELVCDALPLERELALRVLPLLALPLVFMALAAGAPPGIEREGLAALGLFAPGIGLPALVAHLPLSASASARWLLAVSPARDEEVREGALAALAVRWLAPLLVLLGVVAGVIVGPMRALAIWPPAALVALLVLRFAHARLSEEPPLSVPPDELRVRLDWTGSLLGLGVALALLALLAARYIRSPLEGLVAALPFLLIDRLLARRSRPSHP